MLFGQFCLQNGGLFLLFRCLQGQSSTRSGGFSPLQQLLVMVRQLGRVKIWCTQGRDAAGIYMHSHQRSCLIVAASFNLQVYFISFPDGDPASKGGLEMATAVCV